MFKKAVMYSLGVVLMLTGYSSPVSAAQNVANASQKGSLLIFPLVITGNGWDTIINIGNDNTAGTTVKCFWVNRWQDVWDFEFPITANQPIWFRASDGVGGPQSNSINGFGLDQWGQLICFAVSLPINDGAPEQQISWNHLYGSAISFHSATARADEYPAWAFTARGVNTNSPVGTPGQMLLTGTSGAYDACPAYLVYNFFVQDINFTGTVPGISAWNNYLALSPCYQDLTQERIPTCTKAKIDVWNENERKITGAYHCVKCWVEGILEDFGRMWTVNDSLNGDFGYPYDNAPNLTEPWSSDNHPKLAGFGSANFSYDDALHTTAGRFRVTGVSGGAVCAGVYTTVDPVTGALVDLCPRERQVGVPLLGLRTTRIRFGDSTQERSSYLDNTGSTAGAWTGTSPTPQIMWDTSPGPLTAPGR